VIGGVVSTRWISPTRNSVTEINRVETVLGEFPIVEDPETASVCGHLDAITLSDYYVTQSRPACSCRWVVAASPFRLIFPYCKPTCQTGSHCDRIPELTAPCQFTVRTRCADGALYVEIRTPSGSHRVATVSVCSARLLQQTIKSMDARFGRRSGRQPVALDLTQLRSGTGVRHVGPSSRTAGRAGR